MSEFKSQYDRQKQSAENALCVVVLFATTASSSRPVTDRSCFLLKNSPKYDIIMETIN